MLKLFFIISAILLSSRSFAENNRGCDIPKAMRLLAQHKEYAINLAENYETGLVNIGSALSSYATNMYSLCASGCTFTYPSAVYSAVAHINATAQSDKRSIVYSAERFNKKLKSVIANCK